MEGISKGREEKATAKTRKKKEEANVLCFEGYFYERRGV